MNDTARRFADVILPSTSWLEELGCKATNTHLYLMEQGLLPAGETRPLSQILQGLAQRLGLQGFFPWNSQEGLINAILDHPCTGRATVERCNSVEESPPYRSHMSLSSPAVSYSFRQNRILFARAQALKLPSLPVYEESSQSAYPLTLSQGRTLTHFHGFYDHGRALPTSGAA